MKKSEILKKARSMNSYEKCAGAILREAARRIAEGENEYGCNALISAASGLTTPAQPYYIAEKCFSMFKGDSRNVYWFGRYVSEETQNRRVIALLLAAEIAESGMYK